MLGAARDTKIKNNIQCKEFGLIIWRMCGVRPNEEQGDYCNQVVRDNKG